MSVAGIVAAAVGGAVPRGTVAAALGGSDPRASYFRKHPDSAGEVVKVRLRQARKLSIGEERLALHLRTADVTGDDWKLAGFVRQCRFDPARRWAFDFALVAERLAVEVQGLTKGRAPGAHQRVDGLTREYEKLNAAVLAGWRVLLFTPAQVKSGYALDTIRKALA